jgi:biopolymer transport protein ExbD
MLDAPFQRRRLSLTSLIDVIFLLLLFFMLTSQFSRFGDLPFLAATGGAAAPATPPMLLRVGAEGLRLNLAMVDLPDLPQALAGEEAADLLIMPEEGISAQHLVDVLITARSVPGITLHLVGG